MNFANATKISKEAILERKQMLDVAREEDAAIADNLTELSRIKQAENNKTREPNRIVGFFKRLFSFFSRRSASKRYTSGDMSTGSGKERMGGAYEEFLLAQLSFQTGGSTAYKDNAQASLQFSSRSGNGGAVADTSTAAIDRSMSKTGNTLNNSSTVVTYKDKLRLIDVSANFKMRGGFGQTTAEYKAKTATLKLMNEYRKLTVHGNGNGAFTLLHDYTSDTDKFGEVVSADIYYSNAEIETGNFFIRDGRQGPELIFGGANGSITVPDLFKANFFAAEANGTDITASDIMIYPLKNILSWKANESIPMDGNFVMNDNGLLLQTVPFELEDIEAMGGLFKAEQARFNMAVNESGDVGLESNLGKWKLGVSLKNIASIEKTGENTDVEVTEDRRLRIPNNASEKYRLSLLGHDFELQATGADTFIDVGEKFLGLGFNPIDISVGGVTINQAQLNIGAGKGQAELGFGADSISKAEQGESIFPEGMQISNVKGKISEKGVQIESAEMSYTGEIGGVSIGDMKAGIKNLIINHDGVYFDKIAATVNDMTIGSYASLTEAGISLTKTKEDKSININVLFGGLNLNIEDKIPYVDISAEGIKGDISIKEGDSSVSIDGGSISVSVKDFVTLTLNDFAYANGTFSAETVRADILNGGKFESELFCVDSVSLVTTKLAISKKGVSVEKGGTINVDLTGVKLAGVDIRNINADIDPDKWNVKAQADLTDTGYDFDFASLKFGGVIGVDYTDGTLSAVVNNMSASIVTDYFTLSASEINKTSGKDLQFGSVVVSTSKLLGDKAITANVKDLVLSRYASNISFGSIVVNYNSDINMFGVVTITTPHVEIAENFSGIIAGGKVRLDTPLLDASGDFELSFLKNNYYLPSVTKADGISVEIADVAKLSNISIQSEGKKMLVKFTDIELNSELGSGFTILANKLGGTFELSKEEGVSLSDVSGNITASYKHFFTLTLSEISNDSKGIYAGEIKAALAKTSYFGGIVDIGSIAVDAKNVGVRKKGLYGENASLDVALGKINIAGAEIESITAGIDYNGDFNAAVNFGNEGTIAKTESNCELRFDGAAKFGYGKEGVSADLSEMEIALNTDILSMKATGITVQNSALGIGNIDFNIKNINGLDEKLSISASDIMLKRTGLEFSNISVAYPGDIAVGGVSIGGVGINISSSNGVTKLDFAAASISAADGGSIFPKDMKISEIRGSIDKTGLCISNANMVYTGEISGVSIGEMKAQLSNLSVGNDGVFFDNITAIVNDIKLGTVATVSGAGVQLRRRREDKGLNINIQFDDIGLELDNKIPFVQISASGFSGNIGVDSGVASVAINSGKITANINDLAVIEMSGISYSDGTFMSETLRADIANGGSFESGLFSVYEISLSAHKLGVKKTGVFTENGGAIAASLKGIRLAGIGVKSLDAEINPNEWHVTAKADITGTQHNFGAVDVKLNGIVGAEYENGSLSTIVDGVSAAIDTKLFTLNVSGVSKTQDNDLMLDSVTMATKNGLLGSNPVNATVKALVLSKNTSEITFDSISLNYNGKISLFGIVGVDKPYVEVVDSFEGINAGGQVSVETGILNAGGFFEVQLLRSNGYMPTVKNADNVSVEIENVAKIDNIEVTSVQDELRIKFSNIALDKKFDSGFSLSAESLGGTFHLSKKDKVRLTDVSGSINASYQDFFSLSLSDIANNDKGIYAGNINATLTKTDFFGGMIKIAGIEVNAKDIGISSRGLYAVEGASFDALIKGMNIAGCEISTVTAAIGPEGAFEAGINFAEQGSEVKLSDGFSFVFTGVAQFGYDNGTLSIDLSKTGIGFKTQIMEMTAAGISAEVGGFGIEKLDVSIKNIPGLDGDVAAQAKSLLLTRDKLGFESITVSYSDKISLFDGMITVDKPVVDIQNNFERIEASGNIGFTTKVLNAGGDIRVAYDRSKTMPELVSAKNVSLGIDKVGTLSIGEMLTENDDKTLRFNDIALEGFSHDGDGEGRSLFERMCSTIREGMSATLATATYDKTNGLQYNFDDIQFKIKQYKIPFGEKGEAIINVQDKILHLDYAISLPGNHKFPADTKGWEVPKLIELGADYPIIPGAVSVGGSLFAGAAMQATASLDMKLDTIEKSVEANAKVGLNAIAGVGANAKLTIGVPGLASLVLGLEGTLAGMISNSSIQANIGVQMLNSRPDIMKEKTNFSYDFNFNMKSYLKAFVNAKALFVLDKQLYSADIANIDLCKAALSGSAGFDSDGKWKLNDDRVFVFDLGEQLKNVLNIHSAGEQLDKARSLNNKMKEYQAMIGFDVWGSEKAFYTASKLQGDIMSQLSSISELSEYAIKRLASIDKKSIDAEKDQDRSRAVIENKALLLERVANLNSGNGMSEADLKMTAAVDSLLQKKKENNTLKQEDIMPMLSALHDVEPIAVMAYISKKWGLNVKSGSSEMGKGRLGEDDVIKYQNDYVVLRKTLKSIYDRPINYEREHLESLYETAVNSSKKVISDSRLNNQTFMEKSSATLKDIKLKNEEYIKITDQIVEAEKKINEYAEKEKNASAKEIELMNDEASASANQSKIAGQRKKVSKYVLKLDEYKKKKNKLVETQSAISTSLNVIKLQFVNNTDTQKLVEGIGLSANEFRDKRKAMSDQRDKLIDYNKVIRHNEAAIDLSGIHSPENSKTKYDLNPLRAMVNEMGSSSYNDSYKKVIEDFISANTTSVSYDQYKDISDKLLSKNREKNTARYTRLLTHRLVAADKRNQTDFVEDKLLRRMLGEDFTKDVSSEKKGQELIDALSLDMVTKMNTSSSDIEERQNHIRALEDIIIQAAEANSTAISTLYKLNEISPQSFAVDYDPYQENSSTEGVKNSIGTLAKGEEFEDGEYASMINRLHNEAKTITNEIKQ